MPCRARSYSGHVPVTPALLARLQSLDDLVELVRSVGFHPAPADLGPEARARLGLDGGTLGVTSAAVLARHGHFHVYGIRTAVASREVVARAVERLARHSSGRFLLLALDREAGTLALGSAAPAPGGLRARVLRVDLRAPSRIAAEILDGLAPRPGEGALTLSARIGDVLAEEGLTTRFFREFRRMHERAATTLADAPGATPTERRALALVFLTRVLFLYFVQAKGWLAGRSDFLPSLLDLALARSHPFHRAVFEPLCFGALATPPGARRGPARALGAVPFLNGGLFERHALERRHPRAVLPDETWRALFDELFERFHFTVRESVDTDAVDPEMLGRVFEGLMASDDRRHRGAYYTPRPLLRHAVDLTMRTALDDADAARIRTVRILDPAVGSGAFLLEALAWLEQRRGQLLPAEPPGERRRAIVRDCLFGVDVDPMAVRLAELRLWLALVVDETSAGAVCPLPNLDQHLRQGDSLLSPFDVGAARAAGAHEHVRAVAEARSAYFTASGRRKATLARAIRERERVIAAACADADLASVTARLADIGAAERDLFGRRAARSSSRERAVRALRARRQEIRRLRWHIGEADTLPFFAYDVHFGEVVADGGFDVVLGNPPWVRGERLPASVRERLAARYAVFRPSSDRRGFAHLPDLSVAFVERALQLVREDGVVGMLLPAKILRAGYAGPLRAHIRRHATVIALEDMSHAPHGFAATVFPMVAVLRRREPDSRAPVEITLHAGHGGPLRGTAAQQDLPLDPDAPRSPWLALPSVTLHATRHALRAGPRLDERFRPRLGVKTGANEVFVREASRAHELPSAFRVPAVQGRDIEPYRIRPGAVLMALLDRAGRPLPALPPEVTAYLGPWTATLGRRSDAKGAVPWALFRTELLAARWLVLWRDIAGALEAAPLDRRHAGAPVPLNTCYGVAVSDEDTAWWLSAWLNSRPIGALALALAERASGGVYRFSAGVVGALPLPRVSDAALLADLARSGRALAVDPHLHCDALDALVTDALRLPSRVAAELTRLGAALRRDAGRDR